MSAFPTVPAPQGDSAAALSLLMAELRERHGAGVNCIVAYGSCLRSGDLFDGLLDLYLVSDNYRAAYSNPLLALGNWLLPPNVFYAETEHDGRTLRCKYALISARDFKRFCSGSRFESYIWGRFAQPVSLFWSRDKDSRTHVESQLMEAVKTFLTRCLPGLPATGSVDSLWREALALSYATELRSEGSGRAGELAATSREHFATVSRLASESLDFPFTVYTEAGELCYRAQVPAIRRRLSGPSWMLRRGLGKLMSLLRLLKALFTFAGGLDYIAWKLERHSGQEVTIPGRVRRFPLVFIWGFCWQLYRRGIFK
jgi:hypothetical protein